MYRSLNDNQSYIKRVKKLVAIQTNKKEPINQQAIKMAISLYNKIKVRKQAYIPTEGLATGSVMFAYLIIKSQINDTMRVAINKAERKKLGEEKEAFIMSDITKNRLEQKIFYLCSHHSDSAKDHAPYQGKIYIDKEWRSLASNVKAVERYIREHQIKEYQWIIDKPVYMLTRPNCRHYMMPLSESEVLHNDRNYLIDKYNMHRKIGSRDDVQTLGSRGQEIETMINAYKDRLEMHQSLYKIAPNKYLEAEINKDALLYRKWVKMKK